MERRRFFRPGLEGLESREMMAFNLTISPAATVNVNSATAAGTRTFTATGSGANLSAADIDSALGSGLNVVVSSGSGGGIVPPFEIGSISTNGFASRLFNNAANTSLTIRSGSGTLSQLSNISLDGLQLAHTGSLIIDANLSAVLRGNFSASNITITAGAGGVAMPSGGGLAATSLTMTAGGGMGTFSEPIRTNVNQLTTNTSANDSDQFITEADGLTALNLEAGSGEISIDLATGTVADADAAVDTAAFKIFVRLLASGDFGSDASPIGTSVDELNVVTSFAGGSQFITQSKSLTSLNLNASSGEVSLNVLAGPITDTDSTRDVSASVMNVTLSEEVAQNFGSAANPIETNVDSLTVITAVGGGNQFISEESGLTGLNLEAGTGEIFLTVSTGAVSDTDAATDVTAQGIHVELKDGTARDFGSELDPIETDVDILQVLTKDGAGSQYVSEANGLTSLELNGTNAATVFLTVEAGAVAGSDAVFDVRAFFANIKLLGADQSFGSAAEPINTGVVRLSVETNGGDQFIIENQALSGLNLNAGTGDVSLTMSLDAISDTDSDIDITAASASVVLDDATARNFGAVNAPVGTSVDSLTISTSAGGDQYIAEANGLGGLSLNAGSGGDVTLTLAAGGLGDSDAQTDITGSIASIAVSGAGNVGSATRAIETSVGNLSVVTQNGNQFLREENTTLLSANAGMGSITLVSGTFELVAGDAIQDTSALVVNSPAVVNLDSGSETVGSLAGSGTVAFKADGAPQTLGVGVNNQDTTFTGTLTGNDTFNGSPTDFLVKAGSGTLTFSGSHPFTGVYDVIEGKLLITGSLTASTRAVGVFGGGFLGGTGTINREINVFGGGHLAPGLSVGVLNTGNLDFNNQSVFDVEITSANAGAFDRAIVTGSVTIETDVVLNVTKVGTVNLQVGQQLSIITNDGSDAVQGTFKDLPEGANLGSNFVGSGLTATISYLGFTGTQNDVVMTMSPGSLFPWHNEAKAFDVSGGLNNAPDDHVVAGDALDVINYLNAFGAGAVPASAVLGLPFGFLDTDQDNFVTAGDALEVINFINAGLGGEGEGEAVISEQWSVISDQRSEVSGQKSVGIEELVALLAMDLAEVVGRRRR